MRRNNDTYISTQRTASYIIMFSNSFNPSSSSSFYSFDVLLVAFMLFATLGYISGTSTCSTTSSTTTIHMMDSIVIPLYLILVIAYLLSRLYNEYKKSRKEKREKEEMMLLLSLQQQNQQQQQQNQNQPIDMSGSYKLIENENFEELLEGQGVPWALRSAANRARPIHKIVHVGNMVTIKIMGIIESQTTYQINGPPVIGQVRGRIFHDTVRYIPNGIETIKRCNKTNSGDGDGGYTINVQRILSKTKQEIYMTSTLTFDNDNDGTEKKSKIVCKQRFQRI